jgi:hypothetical protein
MNLHCQNVKDKHMIHTDDFILQWNFINTVMYIEDKRIIHGAQLLTHSKNKN